jgi:YteA family regulatory protein
VPGREQIEDYRRWLLEERDKMMARADGIEEDGLGESLGNSTGELSTYDQHPADVASEVFERSKDFALREDARLKIRAIEDALRKMEQGVYGSCDVCGTAIPEERLEALPYTTLCARCKSAEEDRPDVSVRPVEEDFLEPAFRRTANDGKDISAYDGEDAWQDVARWNEHAEGSRAGSYYGDSELNDQRGYTEKVDQIPYYKEDGIIYSSFRGADDEIPPGGAG